MAEPGAESPSVRLAGTTAVPSVGGNSHPRPALKRWPARPLFLHARVGADLCQRAIPFNIKALEQVKPPGAQK